MNKVENVVSLTLGIIGVVIGVLALLSGWIPYLGLAAIPIACIGLLLSGMGVGFACLKKFKSIELPILGCLICIGAIVLPICSSYLARAAEARQQAALAQKQKANAEAEGKAAAEARRNQISRLEAEIATLQSDVTNAEKAVRVAQTNFDSAQAKYNDFMATQPLRTNVVYVKIKKDLAFRVGIIPSQQQTIKYLTEEANKPYSGRTWVIDFGGGNGRPASGHWAGSTIEDWEAQRQAVIKRLTAAKNDLANTYAQINADKQALEKMEQDVAGFQENKLNDADSLLDTAKSGMAQTQSRLDTARSNLDFLKNN
jgi:hypothetical protein